MKKALKKVLIGLCCIGVLGSCGSKEDTSKNVDTSNVGIVAVEEVEEVETTEVIEETEEVAIVESEPAEETISAETEEIVEIVEEFEAPVVEEVAKVQEPEYTYSSLNQTMYASKTVNVRSLPTTDGDKVGGLSAAQAVTVTGKCEETGWYRIEYNGEEAFVSGSYLVDEKPVQQTPAPQSSGNTASSSGGSSSGNLVWISGGERYHNRASCSNMKNPSQVTKQEAENQGYEPCKKCW